MASFKALCLAGVASLAATASVSAADLLPPPPVPVAPVAFTGGGWYLRGDVGVGIADIESKRSTFQKGFDQDAAGVRYDQRDLGDTTFVDAGVGYRFNRYFRADVTGEYRTSGRYSSRVSYTDNSQVDRRGYDTYTGDVRSAVGLVNGYIDLGTWWAVTPFVGGGVGIANVETRNIIDQNPNGGFGFAANHSETKFAWAVMAGLDFAVTQNLVMELGYRHLDLGNISTGAIKCINQPGGGCSEVQHSKLAYNDIRLGFRYTFANLVPAPLVAKY